MAYFFPGGGGGTCRFRTATNSSKLPDNFRPIIVRCNSRVNCVSVSSTFPLLGGAIVCGVAGVGKGCGTGPPTFDGVAAVATTGAGSGAFALSFFRQPVATNMSIAASTTPSCSRGAMFVRSVAKKCSGRSVIRIGGFNPQITINLPIFWPLKHVVKIGDFLGKPNCSEEQQPAVVVREVCLRRCRNWSCHRQNLAEPEKVAPAID